MSIRQNKLVPLMVVIVGLIVVFLFVRGNGSKKIASTAPMSAVPEPGVDPNAKPKGGLVGTGKAAPTRSADADNVSETLQTLVARVKDQSTQTQKVLDANEKLRQELAKHRNNHDAVVQDVLAKVQADRAEKPQAAAGGSANLLENGLHGAGRLISSMGSQAPSAGPAETHASSSADQQASVAAKPGIGDPTLSKIVVPMGYNLSPDGKKLVRQSLLLDKPPVLPATAELPVSAKVEPEPYFTIPENSTLSRTTAMTTLVGRVPVDGRVQDPMQFKMVVGPENLAASGQYVPDDITGIIVSGIAVGDMALSCTEGLIQSLTFVFADGTVRTVSMRSRGASLNMSQGGGGSGTSLATTSKLGWISDEYGNPCIPGKFVTNAPAYLTDVVGAKALSVAGAAAAAAETTTVNGASALGNTSSSTVTGNKGQYILGKTVASGSDELVSWLMRRLNNSFDAVVVKAGTKVAIHIDQSIEIDKEPNGRKLDYGRSRATFAQRQGAHHGMD